MEGMIPLLVIGGIVVMIPLIWVIATYNVFVRLGQHLKESWAGVETELQRRYDLIPNLVEAVKGYAAHERAVFERVASARSRAAANHGSPNEQARDENELIGSVKQLFAVAEAYPQLKADRNFLHLQKELVNTEDRIAAARRFYNGNVRDLNTRVGVFPSNLIAGIFAVQSAEYFEIEDATVRAAPTTNF